MSILYNNMRVCYKSLYTIEKKQKKNYAENKLTLKKKEEKKKRNKTHKQ